MHAFCFERHSFPSEAVFLRLSWLAWGHMCIRHQSGLNGFQGPEECVCVRERGGGMERQKQIGGDGGMGRDDRARAHPKLLVEMHW